MTTELRLEGLSKRFGSTVAVDSIDLAIPDGSLTVIVGPSGSGKSTVLSLIAGLETPDSGAIFLGGARIDTIDPGARDLAMVFQSYALYPHMTARQNLAFPLESRGVRSRDIGRRVADTAAMLGIGGLLDRRPGQMSGGEQQRVALGRALIRSPAAFLLDEPLSNLDERLRVHTRREFTKLHADLGITTLFVTHSQTEAMALGDRLAVMDRGRIRQVGPPQEVYDWPADTFVADFLGVLPMNLIEVAAGRDEHGAHLTGAGLDVRLPEAWAPALGAAAPDLTLGFRPERASLSTATGTGIIGRIGAIELQGSDDVAYVDTASGRYAVRLTPHSPWRIGATAGITIDPAGVRLFDRATGLAIPLERPPTDRSLSGPA